MIRFPRRLLLYLGLSIGAIFGTILTLTIQRGYFLPGRPVWYGDKAVIHILIAEKKKGLFFGMILFLTLGMFFDAARAAEAGKDTTEAETEAETETASLSLNKSSIVMLAGKTYRLRATSVNLPSAIKWRSSDKTVAKVDGTGKVKAKAVGTAIIRAKAGKYKTTCRVTVIQASLNKTRLSLGRGKSKKLKLSGTDVGVTWKSSDPEIVSVNAAGKVKAKKEGTAKIYAGVGVNRLTCQVTVTRDRWDRLLDEYQDDAKTNQLVFVKYTGGSDATVQMYVKSGKKWKRIVNCSAYVGKNGIDKARQGDMRTPTGTFSLTQAYGIKDDPGAKLPYVKVDENLYWCADENYYNQLIDIREKPHSCSGEHLIDYAPNYYYGMFLDYNKENEYKKGAAIFLHCTGPKVYTAGCIAVSQANMIKIIQNAGDGAKICIYPA